MEDFLVCPECGGKYQLLTSHLKRTHLWTDEQVNSLDRVATDTYLAKLSELRKKDWTKDNSERKRKLSEAAKKRFRETDVSRELYEARLRKGVYEDWSRVAKKGHAALKSKFKTEEEYSQFMKENGEKSSRYYTRRDYIYRDVRYKSQWEIELARFLDSVGVSYEYESMSFPYVSLEGRKRRYYPDFYIRDKRLFLEVKPLEFIDESTEIKRKSVESEGYAFMYITGDDLINLHTVLQDIV